MKILRGCSSTLCFIAIMAGGDDGVDDDVDDGVDDDVDDGVDDDVVKFLHPSISCPESKS